MNRRYDGMKKPAIHRGIRIYGVVPKGMREKIAAKPLEEGAYYLVMCGQNGKGGCYGTSFIVENGKAVPTKN